MDLSELNELLFFDRKHLWHPYASMTEPPPVNFAVSAQGTRIRLADGTELLNIDNARIAAEMPIIALGNRNGESHFKDFEITYSAPKKAPTPEPTEAPTQAPTDEPAQQPTDKPADHATQAPQKATDKPADDDTKSDGKKFPVVPVVAGVCGAIVVGAVIAIIVSGKKKK